MNRILSYTKLVYMAFKEVNGKLKFDTSSMIGQKKLGEDSKSFLEDYINFVMNCRILTNTTKIYLASIENDLQEAIRAYNATANEFNQITSKKASNDTYNDTQKLLKYFPEDMLCNVINKKGDLDYYKAQLNLAIGKKLGQMPLGKNSVLKIPLIVTKEVPSEEEIDEFFMLYAPYTKAKIKKVEEQLPMNVVGYMNYISNKSNLTEEEKAKLDRLNSLVAPKKK